MADASTDDLLREMHGDLKVLKTQNEAAAKAREHIRREIGEVKDQIKDHRKVLNDHRNEVTRVRTIFRSVTWFLGILWVGVVAAMRWLSGE